MPTLIACWMMETIDFKKMKALKDLESKFDGEFDTTVDFEDYKEKLNTFLAFDLDNVISESLSNNKECNTELTESGVPLWSAISIAILMDNIFKIINDFKQNGDEKTAELLYNYIENKITKR